MKYEKPEVIVLGNAMDVVKGTGNKRGCVSDAQDPSDGCAYEADE